MNFHEYSAQIQEYQNISLDAYANDWKTQRIIERTLQMMIETCSDIAGHIIADKKLRVPTGYADTFKVLEENQVLDHSLAASLSKMAKFRNVVVHDYDVVDGGIVIGILKKNLTDFMRFKDAIVAFVK